MRAILFLAAAGAVSALSRSEQKANWAALPADVTDDNLELLFAHSLWRHGDRAAEHAVPGWDEFPEEAWTFGGGGYGELSPEGMKMHFNLGRMLRKRYMNETFPGFLSEAYNSKEIYIRSTDYNRTLISAYCNVQGMYSGYGVAGQNYPDDVDGWPTGYVPIPVHTLDYDTDYPGHPDFQCDRQDQLQEMVRNSPEYLAYSNDPKVTEVLKYLSENSQSEVTVENIYELNDPLFCENIHIEDLNGTGADIHTFYPWYFTGGVQDAVDDIIETHEMFEDGSGNPAGINGIDVSVEIPKIRAGDTLKLMVANVDGVLKCKDDENADSCRTFYKTRKYYALSAHDTTLAAFLTILGVNKSKLIPKGYPQYSAALLLEVYRDKTTNERSFKVLYHADKDDDFKAITGQVRGCFTKDYCPIAALYDLVAKYAPDTDMATLCATPVNGAPPTTTAAKPPVDVSTTPTSTSTTTKTTTTTTQTPTTSGVSTLSTFSAFVLTIVSVFL